MVVIRSDGWWRFARSKAISAFSCFYRKKGIYWPRFIESMFQWNQLLAVFLRQHVYMTLSVSKTNHGNFVWQQRVFVKEPGSKKSANFISINPIIDATLSNRCYIIFFHIQLYQLMEVDPSSFKDNKRAATAMEDGCGSCSAQPGSEDAPVYCKLRQFFQLQAYSSLL